MNSKWQAFKLTADFDSDVATLYKAWATQAGLESWFLRKAEFLGGEQEQRAADEFVQPGDSYLWKWHGYSDDVFENGKILDANGLDFIKFTFTSGCTVSIYIKLLEDLVMVELLQEGIPAEDDPSKNLYVQCQTGWVFYLANLKSLLLGGMDLRNKRPDIASIFK